MGIFLAAICHTGGVLASLEERGSESDPRRRSQKVALAYLAALAAIALLVALTLTGVMPLFFIQGQGPTAVRQNVVEWSIVLLLFAAMVMMQRFFRKGSPFLYWYSLALILVAISMLAFFLERAVGGVIGWVGRSSYVFAAIYFLGAVNSARRQARSRGLGLSEAITELFSQVHYRSLFDNMLNGYAYCRMHYEDGRPLDFTYLRVNRAFESLTGLQGVEGKRVSEIIPGVQESDPQLFEIYGRVALSGVPEQFETHVIGLDEWFSISVYSPQKEHFVAIFEVITERKQAEKETKLLLNTIHAEKERLIALVNSISDEVWFASTEKKFTLLNLAALREFGMDAAEEIGVEKLAESLEVYHADGTFRPVEAAPPLRALQGEVVKDCEEIIRTPATGALRHRLVSAAPVKDVDGNIIGSVSVVKDITERKKVGEALHRLNEELEQRVQERTTDLMKANMLLKKSEEDLRHLASKILTAQEQERKRLAIELHDGLGQSLSALKMYLRTIQRHLPKEAEEIREDFEDAQKMLRDTIEETRKISRGLSPTLLENLGLTAAVKYLLEEFSKHSKSQVTFDADDIQDLFPPHTQINLFRVCQEAINNIAKHSLATQVSVAIKRRDGSVNFCIKDNGVGFDFDQFREEDLVEKGMGVAAMDERLRMIGAQLNILSQKGKGTEISFSIPINAN